MELEAVKYGVHKQIGNRQIKGILLASDGFDYSFLEMDKKQVFEEVQKQGADRVARKIRELEEQDPKCNKYTRF